MKTPAGVTITAIRPNGSTEDVTESVSALYDLLIGSMDWGSGFLTAEDAIPVARLARICGFKDSEEAERYLRAEERRRAPKATRDDLAPGAVLHNAYESDYSVKLVEHLASGRWLAEVYGERYRNERTEYAVENLTRNFLSPAWFPAEPSRRDPSGDLS